MAEQSRDRESLPTAPATAPRPSSRPPSPALSAETASLLGLIDKLSSLLEKSDLVELEVQAGETGHRPAQARRPVPAPRLPRRPRLPPGPAERRPAAAAPAEPAVRASPRPGPSRRP